MPYRSETYTQIANRLADWMQDAQDTGGNVSSRVLDLVNRANQSLWMERPWSGLVVRASLTMVGKTAALPAACGRVLRVYHDTDGDGRPDWDYYEGSQDTASGYTVTRAYAKASGFTQTIVFLSTPTHTPVVMYEAILEDFTGTGIEYVYFPGELLLSRAQMFHLEDGGLSASDMYNAIQMKHQRELVNFLQSQQFENRDQRMVHLDDAGTEVEVDRYDLSSGAGSEPRPFDPSFDLRGE